MSRRAEMAWLAISDQLLQPLPDRAMWGPSIYLLANIGLDAHERAVAA